MKKLLISILISSNFLFAYSQKQQRFMKHQFLLLDSSNFKKEKTYVTKKNDTTVILKIQNTNKEGVKKYTYGINNKVLNYSVDSQIVKGDEKLFKLNDFNILSSTKKFYGDLKQEKDIIYFYPWKFTNTDTCFNYPDKKRKFLRSAWKYDKNEYLKEKGIRLKNIETNRKLNGKKFYLNIPDRVNVSTKYRAWQFGALTLPIKVYAKKVPEVAKVQFDANLNLLFGRAWGVKKYGYYAEEEKESWTLTHSFNTILGFSAVELGKANTDNKFTNEVNEAVFSYGFAYGLQYKAIGFFIAAGIDTPLSERGNSWVYEDTPWIGFGLGLGL